MRNTRSAAGGAALPIRRPRKSHEGRQNPHKGRPHPPRGDARSPTRGDVVSLRRGYSSTSVSLDSPDSPDCLTSVSPDSPDSPDCEIAAKRKVRWTWICQSSEPGESVKRAFRLKRAFRPGLSHRYLTDIAPPPPSLRSEKGENKNGIGRFRKKSSAFRPMFSGVRREKRTFFQRWHFWASRTVFASRCKHGAQGLSASAAGR